MTGKFWIRPVLAALTAVCLCSAAWPAPPVVRQLGGITLGESGEAAAKVMGGVGDVSGDFALPQDVAPAGGVTYKLCEGASLVLLVGKISPFEARVLQITVQGTPCDKTAAFSVGGVGLGAKEADLVAKLGQPDREIPRQQMKTVAYNASNVAFTVENGVVTAISVVLRDTMMAEDLTGGEKKMAPADAWMSIGDMRLRGRQYELALGAYQQVLQVAPDNVDANLRLGGLWFMAGDMTKAEASFNKVLAKDPNNAAAVYNMGRVAVKNKKPDDARKLLGRAISLDPGNAAAYNELGLLEENEKHLDLAVKEFQQAAKLAPNASQPHQNLGRLMLAKGNKDGAIDEYSQALVLELRSDNPNQALVKALREALAQLRSGTPAVSGAGASTATSAQPAAPAAKAAPAAGSSASAGKH